VEQGRPKLFTAQDPRDIIDRRRLDLFTQVDSLESELSLIYDQQQKKEMPRVWTDTKNFTRY
jgi:HTH-type transcriptional regulator, sugar sensing transcriptional regulator